MRRLEVAGVGRTRPLGAGIGSEDNRPSDADQGGNGKGCLPASPQVGAGAQSGRARAA